MFAAWRQPRAMLWVTAGVAALGFLIALEIAARRYGLPGPITNQAQEVIFAPKSGFLLYAGMALMMVVLTWRQRFIAAGAAIGIDVVFLLVRWAVDAKMTDGTLRQRRVVGDSGLCGHRSSLAAPAGNVSCC